MSMTLKFRWQHAIDQPGETETVDQGDGNFTAAVTYGAIQAIQDESTHFVEVDEVIVHREITDDEQMRAWDDNQSEYFDYRWVVETHQVFSHLPGRLIEAIRDGKSKWYICTNAWLLNANGDTIERLAP